MNEPASAAERQPNNLIEFRAAAYAQLGNAKDALFESTDAVILMPYEALQDGRPDRTALLRLYIRQMPLASRSLLAGDHTAWPHVSA